MGAFCDVWLCLICLSVSLNRAGATVSLRLRFFVEDSISVLLYWGLSCSGAGLQTQKQVNLQEHHILFSTASLPWRHLSTIPISISDSLYSLKLLSLRLAYQAMLWSLTRFGLLQGYLDIFTFSLFVSHSVGERFLHWFWLSYKQFDELFAL